MQDVMVKKGLCKDEGTQSLISRCLAGPSPTCPFNLPVTGH